MAQGDLGDGERPAGGGATAGLGSVRQHPGLQGTQAIGRHGHPVSSSTSRGQVNTAHACRGHTFQLSFVISSNLVSCLRERRGRTFITTTQ